MGYITNLNELSLLICEQYMPDVKLAVDITLGNGLDVQKFLPYIQEKLIAIDIQQQAIDVSKERLQKVLSKEEYNKIEFVTDNHVNIDRHVDRVDFVFGNLGYLPNSDHKIMTKSNTTLICLHKALKLLNPNGLLSIISYLGQDRGQEHRSLCAFFESLDSKQYKVIHINPLNQDEMAPILFLCQKLYDEPSQERGVF